ncbi:MAG: hypothetical protein Q8N23_16305 [Archangium sp.]|nr:hypothetical protein [Archangium sp.]MDP3575928.1 hypothetical protein [Archangium sp.]
MKSPAAPRQWWFDALLVLACVVAFGPGMPGGLIRYDDSLYIFRNTELLGRPGWAGLAAVWDSSRAWNGQFVEFFPLRDTVYWLVFQRWETWGLPYHLASLAFHVVASVLALRLASALGLSRFAALVAALLFAAHPIHVESVVWASGLKDPMYTAFLFGSLLVFARLREHPRPWLLPLSMLLFIGALLVKSMALSLPLLLLAMERWVGPPTPWRLIAQRLSGFVVVSGLFLVQFVLIGKANAAVVEPHGGSWSAHLVLAAWAQVKYLKQALVPSTFRLIYCFEPPTGLTDARLWLAVLVLSGVGGLLWWWRKQPLLKFGVAWYFACLLPASNLVPFPAVMADRYLYAAVFGVCVVLALLVDRMSERPRMIIVVGSVLGLTLTSAARSALWLDEENLWAETDEDPACLVDRSRPAVDAHLLRFRAATDRRVALQALERALITPGLAQSSHLCEALQNGALLTVELGEPERGEAWARSASERCPSEAMSWSALAQTTLRRNPPLALDAAQRAWRLEPSVAAQTLVGVLQLEAGAEDGERLLLDAVRQQGDEACPVLRRVASPQVVARFCPG